MPRLTGIAFAASAIMAAAILAVLSQPAAAQTTTLTMSSWVSPSHLLTKDVLAVWGQQVEKATNGRIKLQMLPKHPSAAPGTFDAVKDDAAALENAKAKYLGKTGQITELMKGLGKLDPEARKAQGALINAAKEKIEQALTARREDLANAQLTARAVGCRKTHGP